MTPVDQVHAALTDAPQTIGTLSQRLSLSAETVDAALLELHHRNQAAFVKGEGLLDIPAWTRVQRPR